MNEPVQDFTNAPAPQKKSKLPLIIAVIVIVIIVIGGILLFARSNSGTSTQTEITPTLGTTPSPTPAPVIDKESVQIQVLNGTSTPHQASNVAVTLSNAGYNLDNIKTGNFSDGATTTTISYKAGFLGIAEDIQNALNSDFPDSEVSSSELAADSEFDVVVTTGGEQYQAPTPTGDETPTPTPGETTDTPTPSPTPTDTPTPTPTP